MAKRVLLKLSGESFADSDTNFGISPDILTNIADQISKANAEGIEIAVVVGVVTFLEVCKNLQKEWHKLMLTTWVCWQQS